MTADLLMLWPTALWLGFLTSISPCPLATNIAAVSFLGRRVKKPLHVLASGLMYTLGRTLTYVLIGVFLVESLMNAPWLSQALQKYMNLLLGPLLIVVGMTLTGLISFIPGSAGLSASIQNRIQTSGILGAGLLGVLFALSFCPTSAALFFGSLIPLALNQQSGLLLPALYGIGTGLPVLVFALLLAFGARWIGVAFNRITEFEKWARLITGILFILVGGYFCLTHIFRIDLFRLFATAFMTS